MPPIPAAAREEKWKDIAGYENLYQVSDKGRVRSLPRLAWNGHAWHSITARILSTGSGRWRPWVNLYKNNRGKIRMVQHLVLEAFSGPRPPGYEACHFPDRNPQNNRADNLRWGTSADNAYDKMVHGMSGKGVEKPYCQGVLHHNAKMSPDSVRLMRHMRSQGWSFNNLASHFGVSKRVAVQICHRLTWKHVD